MTHAESIFSVQQLELTAGLFHKERYMVQCIRSIMCPHDESGVNSGHYFSLMKQESEALKLSEVIQDHLIRN